MIDDVNRDEDASCAFCKDKTGAAAEAAVSDVSCRRWMLGIATPPGEYVKIYPMTEERRPLAKDADSAPATIKYRVTTTSILTVISGRRAVLFLITAPGYSSSDGQKFPIKVAFESSSFLILLLE